MRPVLWSQRASPAAATATRSAAVPPNINPESAIAQSQTVRCGTASRNRSIRPFQRGNVTSSAAPQSAATSIKLSGRINNKWKMRHHDVPCWTRCGPSQWKRNAKTRAGTPNRAAEATQPAGFIAWLRFTARVYPTPPNSAYARRKRTDSQRGARDLKECRQWTRWSGCLHLIHYRALISMNRKCPSAHPMECGRGSEGGLSRWKGVMSKQ